MGLFSRRSKRSASPDDEWSFDSNTDPTTPPVGSGPSASPPGDPWDLPADVFAPYVPSPRQRPRFGMAVVGVLLVLVAMAGAFLIFREPPAPPLAASPTDSLPTAATSSSTSTGPAAPPFVPAPSTLAPVSNPEAGEPASQMEADAESKSTLSAENRYSYDLNGNLASRTDANGATTRYEYDALNRLTGVRYPDGSAVTYAYDAAGRRSAMTDSLGVTTYEYDIHDRLVSITDANGNTLRYEYDPRGLVTKLTYPDGAAVHYSWDADGQLLTTEDGASVTRYSYDARGRVTGRVLPNGVSTMYRYDAGDRLLSISHNDADGGLLLSFEYEYNAVNNRTRTVRRERAGTAQVTEYVYDSLDRLVKVSYGDGEIVEFEYDAVGNRILQRSTRSGETHYTYNLGGQLLQMESPKGTVTFAYDAAGNMISRRGDGGESARYEWDYENRLRKVVDSDTIVEFGYDGDGRRLVKTVDGSTVEYVQHGGVKPVVAAAIQNGRVSRALIALGHYGEVDSDGQIGYLEDASGSIVGITDHTGALAQTAEYGAFGDARAPQLPVLFGYNGEQIDSESGLLYLRTRVYDPSLGRFCTPDPYPANMADPRTLARYVYAHNNPVNLSDSLGLSPNLAGSDTKGPSCTDYNACNYYVQARTQYRFGVQVTGNANEMYTKLDAAAISGKPIQGEGGRGVVVTSIAYDAQHGSHVGRVAEALKNDSLVLPAWNSTGTDVIHGHIAEVSKVAAVRPDHGVEILVNQAMLGGKSSNDLPLTQAFGSRIRASEVGHFQFFALSEAAAAPAVGGISLNQAAEAIGDLTDITGATYDPVLGQVVLVGQTDTSLPPMDPDDLAVAIRAVYSGEDPGVTMVPVDPSMRDTTQRVEYFGYTQNTHFGLVLFEADRYLKSLAAGQDTLTHKPVSPAVTGFKPEIDLMIELQTQEVPWHRNWFVPGAVVLRRSGDGRSVIFDKVTIKLESRFIKFGSDGNPVDVPGNSPVTNRFTRSVTENYAALASEKPELAELERLAKIVGIVKWLRDSQIPVEVSSLEDYAIRQVDTPRTTPGLIAEKLAPGGGYSVMSMGGVSYDTPNTYNVDAGAERLGREVLRWRPADMPGKWTLQQDGLSRTAVALNFTASRIVGGQVLERTDAAVRVAGGQPVTFKRRANSLARISGSLGSAWRQARLRVNFIRKPAEDGTGAFFTKAVLMDDLRSVIFVLTTEGAFQPEDATTGYQVVGVTGNDRFEPLAVTGLTLNLGLPGEPTTFKDQEGQSLEYSGFAVLNKDGSRLAFDTAGRLDAVRDPAGNEVWYRYDSDRLASILDAAGRGIRFAYDSSEKLSKLTTSDGRAVEYRYDAAGNLTGIFDETGTQLEGYGYDARGRLNLITGPGKPPLQLEYDELGRLTSADGSTRLEAVYDNVQNKTTVTDALGNKLERRFDERGRLVSEVASNGATATYEYDSQDRLIVATDPNGNTTRFTHDVRGLLTEVVLPLGGKVRWLAHNKDGMPRAEVDPAGRLTLYEYDGSGRLLSETTGLQMGDETGTEHSYLPVMPAQTSYEYDDTGRVTRITDPGGSVHRFRYDELGNLVEIEFPGGSKTTQTFDQRGRLVSLADSIGEQVSLDYDAQDRLLTATSPSGVTRYGYSDGRLATITDALGRATRYEYDSAGRLARIIDAAGGVFSLTYDALGSVVAVKDANGSESAYQHDANGRLTAETRRFTQLSAVSSVSPNTTTAGEAARLGIAPLGDPSALADQISALDAEEVATLRELSGTTPLYGLALDQQGLSQFRKVEAEIRGGNPPLKSWEFGSGQKKLVLFSQDELSRAGFVERFEKVLKQDQLQRQIPDTTAINLWNSGPDLKVVAGDRTATISLRELETVSDRLTRTFAFLPPVARRAAKSAGELAIRHPRRLGEILIAKGVVAADGKIMGFNGDLSGLNFGQVFPQREVYRTQGTDVEAILARKQYQEELRIGRQDIEVMNAVPNDAAGVKNIEVRDDRVAAWQAAHAQWDNATQREGIETAPATAEGLVHALQSKRLVVVMVAHSNGYTLYLPDGSRFEAQKLSPEVRQAIAVNAPVVWLFACRTGSIEEGQSLSQELLNAGASGVVAPSTDIPADATAALLTRFVQGVDEGKRFIDALNDALKTDGGAFFENIIGRAPVENETSLLNC